MTTLKNISEYRVRSNGNAHKGNKGVEKFNYAVVEIFKNTDFLCSKHTEYESAVRKIQSLKKRHKELGYEESNLVIAKLK